MIPFCKLLCWDTSSKTGSVAAMEWDPNHLSGKDAIRLVSELNLDVEAYHSEKLLWAIDQVLECAGWSLKDVHYFAVGVGPGSFTGLRIGLTTARTLSHTLGKPLVGVSSLAALARPMAYTFFDQKTLVIAATDACKGELYTLYGLPRSVADCVTRSEGDYPGLWKRGVEEEVLSPEEFVKKVRKKMSTSKLNRWAVVGNGRSLYEKSWQSLPGEEVSHHLPFSDAVQSRFIGILAWEAIQAGVVRQGLQVFPRYLRKSEAELNARKRLAR